MITAACLQPILTLPFPSPLPLQKTSVLIIAPSLSVPNPMKISFNEMFNVLIPLWPPHTELTETEKCFTPNTISCINMQDKEELWNSQDLLKNPQNHTTYVAVHAANICLQLGIFPSPLQIIPKLTRTLSSFMVNCARHK